MKLSKMKKKTRKKDPRLLPTITTEIGEPVFCGTCGYKWKYAIGVTRCPDCGNMGWNQRDEPLERWQSKQNKWQKLVSLIKEILRK